MIAKKIFILPCHYGLKGSRRLFPSVLNSEILKITSQERKYSDSKHIPLPENVESVQAGEIGRFSPQRARDITGPAILSHQSSTVHYTDSTQLNHPKDPHVDKYDCTGSVSLNSSMQSNVPEPFNSEGKSMHLNMPGGSWEKESKFIADDLQNVHYSNIKNLKSKGIFSSNLLLQNVEIKRLMCTASTSTEGTQALTKKEKLKKAVKEYGATVIVFHVGISLISLGGFYLLVSSGLDVPALLEKWNIGGGAISSKVATNASTFITAYAIHKVFAPVRITITLASTPLIVRFLRNIGFLKKP